MHGGMLRGMTRSQETPRIRRPPRDLKWEWEMMKEEDLMTTWDIPGATWKRPEDIIKVGGKNLKGGVAGESDKRRFNRAHGETRFDNCNFSPLFPRHHAPPVAGVRSNSTHDETNVFSPSLSNAMSFSLLPPAV